MTQQYLFEAEEKKFDIRPNGDRYCRVCGWSVLYSETECQSCGGIGLGKNLEQEKVLQRRLEGICNTLETGWGGL